MKSDKTLKKWYRVINRRFFNNDLPSNVCVRWANEDDDAEEEKCEEKYFGWANKADDGRHSYEIVLSKIKINSKSTKLLTLAHEMIHIATEINDDHGPVFEAWRQRIADRGIFRKGALIKGLTIF